MQHYWNLAPIKTVTPNNIFKSQTLHILFFLIAMPLYNSKLAFVRLPVRNVIFSDASQDFFVEESMSFKRNTYNIFSFGSFVVISSHFSSLKLFNILYDIKQLCYFWTNSSLFACVLFYSTKQHDKKIFCSVLFYFSF